MTSFWPPPHAHIAGDSPVPQGDAVTARPAKKSRLGIDNVLVYVSLAIMVLWLGHTVILPEMFAGEIDIKALCANDFLGQVRGLHNGHSCSSAFHVRVQNNLIYLGNIPYFLCRCTNFPFLIATNSHRCVKHAR